MESIQLRCRLSVDLSEICTDYTLFHEMNPCKELGHLEFVLYTFSLAQLREL